MYTLINTIVASEIKGLKAEKLLDIDAKEIRLISLEKNTLLPKHNSPRDTILLVLEGTIVFYINNEEYHITKHQIFNFPKDKEHRVEALENAKFLIIR